MTEKEQLLQEIQDLLGQTSISGLQYLERVHNDKKYKFQNTKWHRVIEKADRLSEILHQPPPPTPPPSNLVLQKVRGRIFLADSPLDCLAAEPWFIPVCTADPAYRHYYTESVIDQLARHFGMVEIWCDGWATPLSAARQMASDFGLTAPPWSQCESSSEFDGAYNQGARRMIGNVSALLPAQLARVKSQEVLLTAELYRNKQPNMQPDWRNANEGIGGNCIACYESSSEGAVYTSVQSYKDAGLYVPHNDCVYGVGLKPADWKNLG